MRPVGQKPKTKNNCGARTCDNLKLVLSVWFNLEFLPCPETIWPGHFATACDTLEIRRLAESF
jgi:hypothetical protein